MVVPVSLTSSERDSCMHSMKAIQLDRMFSVQMIKSNHFLTSYKYGELTLLLIKDTYELMKDSVVLGCCLLLGLRNCTLGPLFWRN